jgi:hypothetical protein
MRVPAQASEITIARVRFGRASAARVQTTVARRTLLAMSRRGIATTIVIGSVVAAVVVAIAFPVTRTPGFHHYADQRAWLGIPHAGDVLSNVPFVVVALWALRRATTWLGKLVCVGVAAIGVGSAAYHIAPSDMTLAFDWGPIAVALMFITAAVIDDRLGARAGRIALVAGAVLAVGSVVIWIAGGGTGSLRGGGAGTVTPYGAVQALGITLPALIAIAAPGRIAVRPLLLALLCFAIARLCAANDRQLLDAIGISGHSLKHVAAAIAAGLALGAITSRAS